MTIETKIGPGEPHVHHPSNLDEDGLREDEWKERQAAEILEKQTKILREQTLISAEQGQGLLGVLNGEIRYHSLEIREFQPPSYQDKLKGLIEKLNAEQANMVEQLDIHRVRVNRYKQKDKKVTGYFLIGKKKDYDFIEEDKKIRYE